MSASIIKPSKPVFDARRQLRVVTNTMTAIAKNIKVDYDVTTQTWKNRPQVTIDGDGPETRIIKVESDIYAMLQEGTKPHDIKPRRKRILRFLTPFRAKTVPNQIVSKSGSTGTNVIISKRGVHHPGTKARNWSKVIAKKWNVQASTIMQQAIDAEYH